ncbi:hypothetical protein U9M48_033402 [Paspalum notatum var. saurae]|uniref:O-fucosyltransferase family protein n=1 Tax=Paspalum notatum var. saurae TaxID=547442 RepID=A0AAQ3X6J9_PASNO
MPEFYIDEVLPILMRRRALQLTKFDYIASPSGLMKIRKSYVAENSGPETCAKAETHELAVCPHSLEELSAEDELSSGKCPLTPHELGLMLRALGFSNDTHLGNSPTSGNSFQISMDKEMLAGDDLEPFLPFSSRLAAIDFIVCDESDVIVTNNNGNMAKEIHGPQENNSPECKETQCTVSETESDGLRVQRGLMGEPDDIRPKQDDFIEFPLSCICLRKLGNISS